MWKSRNNVIFNNTPIKLNIDGALAGNPGNAGIGGVIRNHKGEFIAAFAKNIGLATNNKAETWAFVQGLKIALELDIRNLIIDTDSLFLVSCLNSQEEPHSCLGTLLSDAKEILRNMDQVQIRFCYRELNKVADYMAKMGSKLQPNEAKLFDEVLPCFELFSYLTTFRNTVLDG